MSQQTVAVKPLLERASILLQDDPTALGQVVSIVADLVGASTSKKDLFSFLARHKLTAFLATAEFVESLGTAAAGLKSRESRVDSDSDEGSSSSEDDPGAALPVGELIRAAFDGEGAVRPTSSQAIAEVLSYIKAGAISIYSAKTWKALHEALAAATSLDPAISLLRQLLSDEVDSYKQAGAFLQLFIECPSSTYSSEEMEDIFTAVMMNRDVVELAGNPKELVTALQGINESYGRIVQEALQKGLAEDLEDADEHGDLDGFVVRDEDEAALREGLSASSSGSDDDDEDENDSFVATDSDDGSSKGHARKGGKGKGEGKLKEASKKGTLKQKKNGRLQGGVLKKKSARAASPSSSASTASSSSSSSSVVSLDSDSEDSEDGKKRKAPASRDVQRKEKASTAVAAVHSKKASAAAPSAAAAKQLGKGSRAHPAVIDSSGSSDSSDSESSSSGSAAVKKTGKSGQNKKKEKKALSSQRSGRSKKRSSSSSSGSSSEESDSESDSYSLSSSSSSSSSGSSSSSSSSSGASSGSSVVLSGKKRAAAKPPKQASGGRGGSSAPATSGKKHHRSLKD